jgi:hypothetical protein
MATNDIVQARMIGSLDGQLTVNQFFYLAQSGPGNVAPFLDKLRTGVINNIYGLMAPSFTVVRLEGQRASPKPRTFLATLAINIAGAQTGAAVPSSVSVVVSKHSAFAGRKYRGRWYFAGVPVSQVSASQLIPAAATQWQVFANFCDDVLTDADGTVWVPVISNGYVQDTGVLAYTQIVGCQAQSVLRNQRRRQVGRGK